MSLNYPLLKSCNHSFLKLYHLRFTECQSWRSPWRSSGPGSLLLLHMGKLGSREAKQRVQVDQLAPPQAEEGARLAHGESATSFIHLLSAFWVLTIKSNPTLSPSPCSQPWIGKKVRPWWGWGEGSGVGWNIHQTERRDQLLLMEILLYTATRTLKGLFLLIIFTERYGSGRRHGTRPPSSRRDGSNGHSEGMSRLGPDPVWSSKP